MGFFIFISCESDNCDFSEHISFPISETCRLNYYRSEFDIFPYILKPMLALKDHALSNVRLG